MRPDEEVEQLVREHLEYVKMMAINATRGGDEAGFISAAMDGLWEAVRKHDDDLASLKTFIGRTVKFRLLDHVRNQLGRTAGGREKRGGQYQHVSLDYTEDGDKPLAAAVPDEQTPTPCRAIENQELASELESLIARAPLTDDEDMVLRLYYYEDQPQTAIAAMFGLTESRISQIRTGALRKLKAMNTEVNDRA